MPAFKDLTGKRFGRWTVISLAGKRIFPNSYGKHLWNCRCDCGTEKIVQGGNIANGWSLSCGCATGCLSKVEDMGESPAVLHEKRIWKAMLDRCLNPKNKRHADYHDRGITVCKRWLESFENFLSDMGKRPTLSHSIDRINNDGNYEPGNCRWATRKEQQRNQCNTIMLTLNGETMNVYDWSERTGISRITLSGRLYRGWTDEEALTIPLGGHNKRTRIQQAVEERCDPAF